MELMHEDLLLLPPGSPAAMPACEVSARPSSDTSSEGSNATGAGSALRLQHEGGGRHAAHTHQHAVQRLPPPVLTGPPMGLAHPEERIWLYHLVTFPSYFTPCGQCCHGNRTPKREQLITHFDTQAPYHVFCSHCPEYKSHGASLLQIRRSAFKDVVKASDICRFGADVTGVQQYTLNGSKVVYLSREASADKKGNGASAAPAMCIVDGRAMMDRTSHYCSVKCKLMHEDPAFPAWLDVQDPALLEAAHAAQNAPPRPTVASKRAQQPTGSDGPDSSHSSGSADGGSFGGASSGRAKKPRVSGSGGAVTSAAKSHKPGGGGSAKSAAAKARPVSKPGGGGPKLTLATKGSAGGLTLEPIRTAGPSSAFKPAAGLLLPEVGDNVLVSPRGGLSDVFDLDHAVSSSLDWQLPGSPLAATVPDMAQPWGAPAGGAAADDAFGGLGGSSWGEGPLSPVLGSSGSTGDWWGLGDSAGGAAADGFGAGMGFGVEVQDMLDLPRLGAAPGSELEVAELALLGDLAGGGAGCGLFGVGGFGMPSIVA